MNERDYLMRRAADHRTQADHAATPAHRSLHERFAALYEQRARALGVQEHQSPPAKLPGTQVPNMG